MKYSQILCLFAATYTLPATPRNLSEHFPICMKGLTVALLILLYCGIFVPYSYGADINLLSSDASGMTLELRAGDLAIENKDFGSKNYHIISYEGCSFTTETGKPRLPVSHVYIGVPPSASLSVSVVSANSSNIQGYLPPPVPEKIHETSPDGIDYLRDKFAEDRDFYRRDLIYPAERSVIIYEGYIRRQRVAVLEMHPVQYNPAKRLLQRHSRLVIRVNFLSDAGQSDSMSPESLYPQNDREFEKLYQELLINYSDARNWRKERASVSLAPRSDAVSEALKIFVRKSGIYRIDHAMLTGSGVDPAEIDPRTFKIYLRGNPMPIYVKGEADGRFNEQDYIEFFAARADNIYTRWDVYRLTWGGVRGMRMAQRSGSPDALTAREVTSFTSVERFEEDHLHHKLQNVQPDPDDPEAWFESRDHWFWDGIENGSSKAEVTVSFPAYDLAQSLARPGFSIELVGCTNFEHNVIITLNGYKVGDEAQWERQDIYSFDGQISGNALQEGMNEVRLTRIGSNPADGSNTDNYPYQVYLNWFEIEYIRKLQAVNDRLIFFAPEPEDSDVEEVNRYTIGGFMSDDIEIFQITDTSGVCKFKNIQIQKYALDQEGLDRIRNIHSMLGEEAIFDVRKTAYRAIFEDSGGRSSRYIAVTPASVLIPERIEIDAPSNLKSPANQADYIIISHPTFINNANELAEWRSGTMGGGFRSMVVDVTDIYDEFGFGMTSPHAIKDFLKFAYNNWAKPAPAYVLIFGDATFDHLGIKEEFYEEPPELTAFIPTFYIHTTFGQTAADHWFSTIEGDDGFPDIYLGRIPVEDIFEAETVLKKIIANESGSVNGAWRKQIISIADDDTHAAGDEQFRAGLEEIYHKFTPPGYDTERIYLKDITQQVEQNPLETRRPAEIVEEMIIDAFGKGAVIAQYSGHGGRHVWAHEIVFSIVDIENMEPTDIYPFMLVLSCYNGYFDLPGELSMAEGLLRADGRGIVAMLSATRLTYGSGNIALNKLLFEGIFEENILRIGKATAISKTRLLIEEGLNWLNQMQEYTLFGDPASRLNIADYEMHPQLNNASVEPGGFLEVRPGQVVKAMDGQPVSFSGQLTATVSFPDGSEISEPASIDGNFPAFSFKIPAGMRSGQGILTLFGENASEIAVGGAKFSISEPAIVSVDHDLTGGEMQFYARINDDAGISGIRSVVLTWKIHNDWKPTDSPMVFDSQNEVYQLEQPLSISPASTGMTYYITVEDVDGNSIRTDSQVVDLASIPNLTIYRQFANSSADISYGYSEEDSEPGIHVQIENTAIGTTPCDVKIFVYSENPDRNSDGRVDRNTGVDRPEILGKGWLREDDWDENGMASVFVPSVYLPAGRNIVYVWVDPEINWDDDVYGDCEEKNEQDNVDFRILDISQTLLRPSEAVQTSSSDGILQFSSATGSVERTTAIAVDSSQEMRQPANQPSVSFAPLPQIEQSTYEIHTVGLNQNSGSENLRFQKPMTLKMRFDIGAFTENIKTEIGLGDIPMDSLIPEQREFLEQALRDELSNLAIHRWYGEAHKWARLDSAPDLDENGDVLRKIHNTVPDYENAGDGSLRTDDIEVDNALTPAGEWVILLTQYNRFQLYFREAGGDSLLRKLSDKTGYVGQTYYDDISGGNTGIRFTISQGDTRFQFGDILRFMTIESTDQAGGRTVNVRDMSSINASDVIVRSISIDEGHEPPLDEWVILFLNSQHFHLQGQKTGVIEQNGEPYIGTLGEEFHDPATGFRFTIISGTETPKAGHKFRFSTTEVGEIQAASETTGTFGLMLNTDNWPPAIKLDIAHQNFSDGDVVSSEPTIHALISDDNGVDMLTHGLSIAISRNGDDFEPADDDEYSFTGDSSSNDVPVNYWPGKLETGEYEVKFQAYDFNGNSNTASINFVVKGDFRLSNRSLMNYPNPFERETDITFHVTSLADEAIIKIYTVSGRLIRTLEQSHAVNFVIVHWDGRDEDGEEVANGTYYYKLRMKREGRKDVTEVGKMMKLK